MDIFTVNQIGTVQCRGDGFRIVLLQKYAPALVGLSEFGHLNILWWFSKCADDVSRSNLQEPSPYKNSPEQLGVFATRSPMRPNPIALSCVKITYVDVEHAVIGIAYTDAEDGTPVLDIKPYTPSLDRVEQPRTPQWCTGWPQSLEQSADFDWSGVFQF